MRISIEKTEDRGIFFSWEAASGADLYRVYWTDKLTKTAGFLLIGETPQNRFFLNKSPHAPYGVYVEALDGGRAIDRSPVLWTPVTRTFHEQREKLNRGLVAIQRPTAFSFPGGCSWRKRTDIPKPA